MESPFLPVLKQCAVEFGANTKRASGSEDRGSEVVDVLFVDPDWGSIGVDTRSLFKKGFGNARSLNDENLSSKKSAIHQVAWRESHNHDHHSFRYKHHDTDHTSMPIE